MLRHKNLLQGTHFYQYTDHRALEHILKQPVLSRRQAKWLEKISDFDFTVKYILDTTNILVNTLSHIYSSDLLGTTCSKHEYTLELDEDNLLRINQVQNNISQPLKIQDIAYIEARLASVRKNPPRGTIASRLCYRKARLITRNLKIDL